MSCGFSPRPTDSDPCGSKSTSRTLRPYSARAAPRLIVVVVLPTPPFWLHIAMTRALPCSVSGRGSGRSIIGRPVGPSGRSTWGRSNGRASLTVSVSVGEGLGGLNRGGISVALLPCDPGYPENVPPLIEPLLVLSTRRLVAEHAGDTRPALRRGTRRTPKPPARQGNLLMNCAVGPGQ